MYCIAIIHRYIFYILLIYAIFFPRTLVRNIFVDFVLINILGIIIDIFPTYCFLLLNDWIIHWLDLLLMWMSASMQVSEIPQFLNKLFVKMTL